MQREVLAALNHEASVPLADIASNLRIAWILPSTSQDRAVALMRLPKMHAWITAEGSCALFVNGNAVDTLVNQSPLSFVCAKLVDSIRPIDRESRDGAFSETLALSFFCGQHRSFEDTDAGPRGLIRNLLAQLLKAYRDFDLALIRRLLQVHASDVNGFCAVFASLVRQVPPRIKVFCIIDSVTFYEESRSRRDETYTIVQTLVDIARQDDEYGPVFKLLLTSPGSSRELYKILDKEDVVWMPSKATSRGGFASMHWSSSIGYDLEALNIII